MASVWIFVDTTLEDLQRMDCVRLEAGGTVRAFVGIQARDGEDLGQGASSGDEKMSQD